MSDNRHLFIAAMLMAAAAVLLAVDSVIVRYLSAEVHPFVIAFFRAFFGLLAVMPWILRNRRMLQSSYRWLHVVRAALKLGSLIAFFIAIAGAPIANVTTIAFASPLFLTVGAWLWLKEPVVPARVIALCAGFIGVLIVLAPSSGPLSVALWFALLGALLQAVIQLLLKSMSALDSTDTLVAWNLLLSVPLGLIPALFVWQMPSPPMLGLLALQGAIGALNMTVVTRALSLAEASWVAPIDFLRLPAVALIAYLLFGEVAPLTTWIGAVVIFSASLFMVGQVRFFGTRGLPR